MEVLPLDEERLNEARIVIPFWQKAINDPQKAAVHQQSMDEWLTTIKRYLAEARASGDVSAAVDDTTLANQLLNMLLGAQIVAALGPGGHAESNLERQLEGFFALLSR
jgi:hypothetical protein